MSKSKFNVVNPDRICEEYGADTLRLYEMFLGPIQDSKPWSTKGIDGTHRFLKKLWSLFYNFDNQPQWDESKPSQDSLKTHHNPYTNTLHTLLVLQILQILYCHLALQKQKC